MAGIQTNVIDLLNSLIELDYDAIEAYKAAVHRIEDTTIKQQLESFMGDHESHVAKLTPIVARLGGQASTHGDMKQVLTKGKVVVSSVLGDRAILMAMRTNEIDTNTAYERAVAHKKITEDVRDLLRQNLSDERRHLAWIESRLSSNVKRSSQTAQSRPQ
jgi:uncharacterized protein (TIGR02284 family)